MQQYSTLNLQNYGREVSPLTLAEPYHELLKASVQELILKVGEEQGNVGMLKSSRHPPPWN